MKVTFFTASNPTRKPFVHELNKGIEAVPALLRRLRVTGCEVELIDISNLNRVERFNLYSRLTWPAINKRYEVRRMFGTGRNSACWFGFEVPALYVTGMDPVGDTYPHRKGNRVTTIHSFLTQLLAPRNFHSN
jgi:hypothetical protein